MPGEHWNGSGEDWQQLVLRLLKVRYPVGEFVEVPDTVCGDCGIEGFGRDGKAFQCYVAQEPLPTAELTKRQKAKVTRDLDKLVSNRSTLRIILGETQLRFWILVVPRWEDKDLQVHAQAKAKTMMASGTVKSVSGTSLVVTGGGKDWNFTMDSTTKFVGKGLSTKSREKGGKITAMDAVAMNDSVTVTYHDMGGTMHAAQVRVNNKAMATKK